jgi:CheY-like chemotaxis protein
VATILLVDDDAHIIRVMSIWLERNGFQLVTANNGAQALEIIRRGGIDLVVSDMTMPVMDGATMVATMREQGFINVPVMLLTARCDRELIDRLIEPYNVTAYPKPFVPSKLVSEVERLLNVEPVPAPASCD